MSGDTTVLTPELQARAVEIADECMRAQIECHGVGLNSELTRFGLTDESQLEVAMLDEASDALVEAFEYLRDRGLAALESDNECDVIVLKEAT